MTDPTGPGNNPNLPAPAAPTPGAPPGGSPPPSFPKTGEDWDQLVKTFGPVGKWLAEQWRWKVERDAEEAARANKHTMHVIVGLMIFLGAIIAAMSVLTFYGRVSGDALLFLVGTVSGVVLVMIQRYLFESEPEDSSGLF